MQGDPAPRGRPGRPRLDPGRGLTVLSRLRSFLTTLIWRKRFEDDLDEELRFHLESHAEDLVLAGMPRADAERRAREHLGSVEQVKDASRLARGLRLADELERDLRLATRMVLKDRWRTLGAASVLALAIGSATGMFTLVNSVSLRGLPVDDERIVFLGTRDAGGREGGVSLSDLEAWRAGSRSFSGMAAYVGSGVNVGDDVRPPALVPTTLVSANLFRLVGAEPALGRGFSPEEERPGAAAAVVLGHALWQGRYGGDPKIVGREIRVDSRPSVVIGVMPEGFRFPRTTELWLPLGFMDAPADPGGTRSYFALGRLADGATMDGARTELNSVAGGQAVKHLETDAGARPIVQRYSRHVVPPQRGLLTLLMGAVGLVLLIACANLGGLSLSRSALRSREVTLRASLGASRRRVVRQMLVESTLLAAIGSLLGVAVAFVAVRFFGAQLEQCRLGCMPYRIEWTPDLRVLALVSFTGLAAAALCGAAPALHVSRRDHHPDPGRQGRGGGGTRAARHWTNGLLAAQVALTLVLLIGAGLMVRSFVAMHAAASVVDGENLLTFGMRFRESASREDRKALLQAVEDRLAAMPELSASTLSSVRPFGGGHQRSVEIRGRPPGDPLPDVTYVTIGDDYFETLGLPLLVGRSFDPPDGGSARDLAIVNERFVDVYLGAENPLGQRFRLSDRNAPAEPAPWIVIVGVAPAVPQRSRPDETEPVVYLPLVDDDGHGVYAMVRPRAGAGPVLPRLRDELASVDMDLALFDPMTLEEAMATARRWPRALMTMLGLFGGLGLVLASVGVYGATAHAVAQRRQEIGIRMALGAPRNRVLWQLTRRPMASVAVGLALGTAAAAIVVRVLDSLPVRTSAADQLTFLAPLALVVLIALVAGVLSARQAAHIDPSSVLRGQ